MDPTEVVLSTLSHVDRQAQFATDIDVPLNARSIRRRPILVKLENRIRIPSLSEHVPVGGPVGAFVADHVIAIDLADRRGELPVEIAQLAGVEVLVFVWQGLVEQVISGDHGLVAIARRERPPQLER